MRLLPSKTSRVWPRYPYLIPMLIPNSSIYNTGPTLISILLPKPCLPKITTPSTILGFFYLKKLKKQKSLPTQVRIVYIGSGWCGDRVGKLRWTAAWGFYEDVGGCVDNWLCTRVLRCCCWPWPPAAAAAAAFEETNKQTRIPSASLATLKDGGHVARCGWLWE